MYKKYEKYEMCKKYEEQEEYEKDNILYEYHICTMNYKSDDHEL